MTYLPDVNVWISLTSDRHVHHSLAKEWLQNVNSAQIAFCRITELGFLRLLTNAHVMGQDVLTPVNAWHVYDEWLADSRVAFLLEQPTFSEYWHRVGGHISGGPNSWTDAYLAAFAAHSNATVVTLDRKFLPLGNAAIQSLL